MNLIYLRNQFKSSVTCLSNAPVVNQLFYWRFPLYLLVIVTCHFYHGADSSRAIAIYLPYGKFDSELYAIQSLFSDVNLGQFWEKYTKLRYDKFEVEVFFLDFRVFHFQDSILECSSTFYYIWLALNYTPLFFWVTANLVQLQTR